MTMSQRSHLAEAGGILQSQAPELFASSLATADSSSTATAAPNAFTNLSISNLGSGYSSPVTPPLSLNSGSLMMMPGSLDPFGHRALGAFAGNAPAYTSATALLQKAAEMGAKISDNTIAPIILKGFSGYSANNTETMRVSHSRDSNMTDGSIPIHHRQIGAGFLPSAAESIAGNRIWSWHNSK